MSRFKGVSHLGRRGREGSGGGGADLEMRFPAIWASYSSAVLVTL